MPVRVSHSVIQQPANQANSNKHKTKTENSYLVRSYILLLLYSILTQCMVRGLIAIGAVKDPSTIIDKR